MNSFTSHPWGKSVEMWMQNVFISVFILYYATHWLTITIFVILCNSLILWTTSRHDWRSDISVIIPLHSLMFDNSINKVNPVYVIKYKITRLLTRLQILVHTGAYSDPQRQGESSDGKQSVIVCIALICVFFSETYYSSLKLKN